jgi:hypothetical protein
MRGASSSVLDKVKIFPRQFEKLSRSADCESQAITRLRIEPTTKMNRGLPPDRDYGKRQPIPGAGLKISPLLGENLSPQ